MFRALLIGFTCVTLTAACDGRPLEPIETSAVRACIRSVACKIKSYPHVDHCIDDLRVKISPAMTAVLASIYHCVNNARTCEEVRSCYGVTGHCDRTFAASCDDQVAVTCDLVTHNVFQYDCGAVGSSCILDEQYGFHAECADAPSSVAFKTSFVADCVDEICQIGQACDEENLSRCDGARLQLCLEGNWVSYDCSALTLGSCQMTGNGWGFCSAP